MYCKHLDLFSPALRSNYHICCFFFFSARGPFEMNLISSRPRVGLMRPHASDVREYMSDPFCDYNSVLTIILTQHLLKKIGTFCYQM